MKEGDDPTYSYGSYFGYTTNDMMSALIIGNLYRDPYIKGRWLKEFALGGYSADPLWSVLFNDPTVPAKEPDDLPLTLFNSYPLTAMTARTNWQGGLDAPTVVANMTMKEINFGDHMHRDAGSFQVYYKGSLALDAGNYQGQAGGYGAPHDMNYNKRSVAHNVITVLDPGEVETRSGSTVNDGGQRWAGANSALCNTFEEIVDPSVIMTEELAHGAGPNPATPEYSFLKGDLTKSYTDKVTGHDRNFVFLDLNDEDYPAAIIVFDKVDAKNKDFKKSWLLHSIEEPQVSGNTTTIARTEYGFNGKLVNQTLLPEASNLTIEKIGGEGKESWVAGENFPNPNYDGKNATEQGNWRIEASPKKASESDLFLNAMYVTDNDRNLPQLPMDKLDL